MFIEKTEIKMEYNHLGERKALIGVRLFEGNLFL